jgi:hypothetical protein
MELSYLVRPSIQHGLFAHFGNGPSTQLKTRRLFKQLSAIQGGSRVGLPENKIRGQSITSFIVDDLSCTVPSLSQPLVSDQQIESSLLKSVFSRDSDSPMGWGDGICHGLFASSANAHVPPHSVPPLIHVAEGHFLDTRLVSSVERDFLEVLEQLNHSGRVLEVRSEELLSRVQAIEKATTLLVRAFARLGDVESRIRGLEGMVEGLQRQIDDDSVIS